MGGRLRHGEYVRVAVFGTPEWGGATWIREGNWTDPTVKVASSGDSSWHSATWVRIARSGTTHWKHAESVQADNRHIFTDEQFADPSLTFKQLLRLREPIDQAPIYFDGESIPVGFGRICERRERMQFGREMLGKAYRGNGSQVGWVGDAHFLGHVFDLQGVDVGTARWMEGTSCSIFDASNKWIGEILPKRAQNERGPFKGVTDLDVALEHEMIFKQVAISRLTSLGYTVPDYAWQRIGYVKASGMIDLTILGGTALLLGLFV
jgi:hypothetical protein